MRWSFLILVFLSTFTRAQDQYWQQQVDYTINVTLDDVEHMLHGEESFVYQNNSPDTLEFIIVHLWPNAYSSKRTALAKQLLRLGQTDLAYATSEEMGYIDSLAFTLDGLPCVVEYDPVYVDICTLKLERPLFPGNKVEVATPFRVKLPTGKISRLGHIGESYQITQWYPKPAVYDDEGWHGMPYLTQGEFYSEFGSYDVSITIPKNYTLGATGDLQSQDEIKRLDSLAEASKKRLKKLEVSGAWKDFAGENGFPESDTETKTLRYTQSKVHDFAWFADKRFLVLKGKVSTPHQGDTVTVWTMFTKKDARLWKESIEYMKDAIHYYSLWNGDYPYKQATAVDGTISAGGGMEYPNVTVIGSSQTPYFLETVIMHEVGHNWFYGILGSNERDHPWMDEGINSYNEQRYMETKYPEGTPVSRTDELSVLRKSGLSKYGPGDLHYFTHLTQIRRNQDQPLNLPANEYRSFNYAAVVYSKPALTMDHMRRYLGDSLMDASMQAYFEAYKFKHPRPEDFREVITQTSGDELKWFFDDVLHSTKKMDWKISRAKKSTEGYEVKIKNKGGIPAPIPVTLDYEEGQKTIWLDGFQGDTSISVGASCERVSIDGDWLIPEIKRDNNASETSGLLRRVEPFEASFLLGMEDPSKNQLYYTPVVGLNDPNGVMPGVAIYNSVFPVKRWNYYIMPMFSLKALRPVGQAELYYMFTPIGSAFESIDLGVKAKHYLWNKGFENEANQTEAIDLAYTRLEPYVRFDFNSPRPSGFYDHELVVSSVVVNEDELYTSGAITLATVNSWSYFNRASYRGFISHPILETSFSLGLEQSDDFFRSNAELNNTFKPMESLSIASRGFVGYFLNANTNDNRYAYQISGQNGASDYAYDGLVLDRAQRDDLLSRQMLLTHGALKVPVLSASTFTGLAAYNGELFVKRIPISAFADVAYDFDGELYADAGLALKLGKQFFSIYVPLVYSANIQDEVSKNSLSFTDLIRFQISFDRMDLMEVRRQLSFL